MATDRAGGRRPDRPRRRRKFRPPRRKRCAFCKDKTLQIDYKKVNVLRSYLTDRAKIRARRKTGVCAKHQRRLAVAIKRARHLALMPFTVEHLRPR